MENLQKNLETLSNDYLMIGYHYEAISSVCKFPEAYIKGKLSARKLLADILEAESKYWDLINAQVNERNL